MCRNPRNIVEADHHLRFQKGIATSLFRLYLVQQLFVVGADFNLFSVAIVLYLRIIYSKNLFAKITISPDLRISVTFYFFFF